METHFQGWPGRTSPNGDMCDMLLVLTAHLPGPWGGGEFCTVHVPSPTPTQEAFTAPHVGLWPEARVSQGCGCPAWTDRRTERLMLVHHLVCGLPNYTQPSSSPLPGPGLAVLLGQAALAGDWSQGLGQC